MISYEGLEKVLKEKGIGKTKLSAEGFSEIYRAATSG